MQVNTNNYIYLQEPTFAVASVRGWGGVGGVGGGGGWDGSVHRPGLGGRGGAEPRKELYKQLYKESYKES